MVTKFIMMDKLLEFIYYKKEDALDIIKLNRKLNERKQKETSCNIIPVNEE